MTQSALPDRDRSFALAKRTHELMRDYGPAATPRSYAVWYAYVSGEMPTLVDAVKRLTADKGHLTEADIDQLHECYIGQQRRIAEAEVVSRTILAELAAVMEILDLSLGSTRLYGESLSSLTHDLSADAISGVRLAEILASLAVTTREVVANNRVLELRMNESRNEIETLREKLEATRTENLTDALTGLANRRHFEETLEGALGAVARAGTLSLIVVDIDFFKRFNDLYGHLTGDQVLRLVAVVMRESTGPTAHLARFGGEEFGIILPDADRATAVRTAETIRTNLLGRELVKRSTGESLGKVTVSLGVAEYRGGDTPASLLERADLCMFAAKRAGRNRVVSDGALAAPEAA
ncbi:GGDEF domain-containing protein [Methylobacterium aerolatum]|uniref:diguanylate cyclase n=1 Tax=Methylobacterium aerolatum TaxID=418708 RepID=A0ABU0I0X0_9HYPH|nr:GGDEF domain-containing protein [Methylobacterium aerolatum]MDQ0448254.1 diguanylate cyclase [Methylobacterium aerolatum]GJD35743.1 Diguanylate cyclase VdcA [Methylobacterium aerolatum]